MNTFDDARVAIDGGGLVDVEEAVSDLDRLRRADPKAFYGDPATNEYLDRLAKRTLALSQRVRDLVR